MSEIGIIIKETKKYLTKYDYEKVSQNCDKILEIDPKSSWGLRFKGISLFQRGKDQEALKYYEKLYELYPEDESAKYTLATLYEDLGMNKKALKLYDEMHLDRKRKRLLSRMKEYSILIGEYNEELGGLENREETPEMIKRKIVLLEEKGAYQYRNQEYDEAYNNFKEVSQLYQNIKDSSYNRKVNQWYDMLVECIKKYPVANDFFTEFFKAEKNTQIWYNRLKSNFSQFEDPMVFVDILLETNPDNIEILRISAIIADYNHNEDFSLSCWKKILELEPENTEAIEKILYMYSQEFSKDKALKLINSKLYIEEIRTDLLKQKIRLLETMTLYDEALDTYDEYFSLDLTDVTHKLTVFDKIRCIEQKAVDLYLENSYEDALVLYKEVSEMFNNAKKPIGLMPGDEWDVKSWYMEVLDESILKSDDNPELFFKEFYKLNKKTIACWIKKIESLISWEKFGNPIVYCNILLNKNSENTQILLAKADVYYRTKRLQKAIDCYEEILIIEPDNIKANTRKFNLLIQRGEYSKAYDLFSRKEIDFNQTRHYLGTLARHLLNEKKYKESENCYKVLLNEFSSLGVIRPLKQIWHKTNDTESQSNSPYYLSWIETINFKHESVTCPECGNKIIPIVYGYRIMPAEDEDFYPGGCCEDLTRTHYCRSCQKAVNMGVYGIDITTEPWEIYKYTHQMIDWITKKIEDHPEKTLTKIEKEAYRIFSLDNREFTRFIEKLEEIGHITRDTQCIKLVEGYDKFCLKEQPYR